MAGCLCLRLGLQYWCVKELVVPIFLHCKLESFFLPAMQLLKPTLKKKCWASTVFQNCHQILDLLLFVNGKYFISNTKKKNFLPCYWVYCYRLRIMKLQINQGDTYWPVVITNKDPVTDMVHKIEIPGEPINRHLLHIWKNIHTQNHWIIGGNLVP